ncbi:ABC transporter ATP-binding protein [Paracoccus sediminicola]|uniref:ABC transporter ATP-binding protein n=1 Tax=Paracoccus sediminicola TaxID=3017783 RepID=UPI0022F094AB|nr:ABC transporter ATP-binding protein [Paracoccus sediminicola]WBU56619.1 ABC transporter ATP-binding protein [Paracoccus sediminicola]
MTSTNDDILVARDLTKEFRGFRAVDGVDLNVRRGSIHAMIGPNGAGKTTCFNLLTKFLQPTAGTIMFDGQDVTSWTADRIARKDMVRSFQISAVFPEMTAAQNVRIALQRRRGHNFDFWRSEKRLHRFDDEARELLSRVGLAEFADEKAAALSYGRKRALELATTVALDPRLLLLDEPMAGMGREDVARITELIREIARDRTILLVEHNLSVVETLSDRITVLARGAVLAEGDYAEVSNNPDVIDAYIGAGHD